MRKKLFGLLVAIGLPYFRSRLPSRSHYSPQKRRLYVFQVSLFFYFSLDTNIEKLSPLYLKISFVQACTVSDQVRRERYACLHPSCYMKIFAFYHFDALY